jgi:hypothetical protein
LWQSGQHLLRAGEVELRQVGNLTNRQAAKGPAPVDAVNRQTACAGERGLIRDQRYAVLQGQLGERCALSHE